MDDLADFEPRRWFRKLKPDEKTDDADKAETGLASLSTMDETDEELLSDSRPCRARVGSGRNSVLCIGGHTQLDEASAAMLAGHD